MIELWGRISCLWDRLEILEVERSYFKKDKLGIKVLFIEVVRFVLYKYKDYISV